MDPQFAKGFLAGTAVCSVVLFGYSYQNSKLKHLARRQSKAINMFKEASMLMLQTAPPETVAKLDSDLDFWLIALEI